MSCNPPPSQQWCLTELCSGYLWFHVQDRDHALCMDLPDGLQSGAIHGVLMASILQIVIVADVLHHLVMRHKVIVLSVLLILLWRPSCVWTEKKKKRKYCLGDERRSQTSTNFSSYLESITHFLSFQCVCTFWSRVCMCVLNMYSSLRGMG